MKEEIAYTTTQECPLRWKNGVLEWLRTSVQFNKEGKPIGSHSEWVSVDGSHTYWRINSERNKNED
jgi:hypothetical protein